MNFKIIQSAQNNELKHIARLINQARYRHQNQLAVLEGVHLIEIFTQSGYEINELYLPKQYYQRPEILALMNTIPSDRITLIAEHLLAKISDLTSSKEPIAIVTTPKRKKNTSYQDAIILERIQDPGNVGTILRTALAAGINYVVLSKETCDVWSPKVLRSAMGAHAYLDLITVDRLSDWLADYPHPIYATTLNSKAHNLFTLDLRQPAGWLFGNEGTGLSAEILQIVAQHIIIPMAGHTESLNVAMAATVCLFEQYRQRNAADKMED